jgi:dephospho-CoA kinase
MNTTACKTSIPVFSSTLPNYNSSALVLGVVGGIGSGKSLFCSALANSGAAVIEADALTRTLHTDPEIQSALRLNFGDAVFRDGEIDRKQLARLVFADPERLARLDAVMLPVLSKRIIEEIGRLSVDHVLVAIDMANLYRAGLDSACDAVVRIRAPLVLRKARLSRCGLSEEEIANRIRSQRRLIRGKPDWIVDNGGGVEDLARKARRIYERMAASIRSGRPLHERMNP